MRKFRAIGVIIKLMFNSEQLIYELSLMYEGTLEKSRYFRGDLKTMCPVDGNVVEALSMLIDVAMNQVNLRISSNFIISIMSDTREQLFPKKAKQAIQKFSKYKRYNFQEWRTN